MKKYSLVSVIVPVYNVEEYIEECLDSIVGQTYSNIEIIAVDDGSTDSSNQRVQPYTKDGRVQLIEQENQGLSGARNTGLKAARGEYILFVDSDDYIEATAIEELVAQMEAHQVDLIRFNGVSFLDGKNTLIEQNNYNFSHRLDENKIYTKDIFRANRKSFASPVYLYIFRREIVKKNNISFFEKILHEDELFTTQIFLEIKSMMYVNKNYYHRRYRNNSIMTTRTPERMIQSFESYFAVYKELKKLHVQKKHSREQKKLIKKQALSIYSTLRNSEIESNKKERCLKQLKDISTSDKIYISLKKGNQYIKLKMARERNKKSFTN